MSDSPLAFVCVVGIVGVVAVVGILSKQWLRVRTSRTGVEIESHPSE